MTMESALAFTATLALWVLLPGPGNLMIAGRALSGGVRATLGLITGMLLGDVLYMVLVFLGLAALGQALGEFFVFVRIAAGLYLIWLGIKLWRTTPEATLETGAAPTRGGWRDLMAGFGLTLGNPKAILFHLAFLPTFFDLPGLGLWDALAIMAIFLTMVGLSFLGYAAAAAQARGFFQSPRRLRILNRASGSILIGAGGAVILKR